MIRSRPVPEIFFISDLHIGHEKILVYERSRVEQLGKSVEECAETMIQNWNKTVRKKDTVWVLGDIVFGRAHFAYLKRLNGILKMIGGNHDVYPIKTYLHYFDAVFGAHKLDDFILTHIPIHESQKHRFRGNIHGHLHSKVIPDPFYYNVSCERVNYTPMPFNVIKETFDLREQRGR